MPLFVIAQIQKYSVIKFVLYIFQLGWQSAPGTDRVKGLAQGPKSVCLAEPICEPQSSSS